jgi:hypothetical protein
MFCGTLSIATCRSITRLVMLTAVLVVSHIAVLVVAFVVLLLRWMIAQDLLPFDRLRVD